MINNLSWLTEKDYFTPINLFESKKKETLIESDKISVFVSNCFVFYIIQSKNVSFYFQHKLILYKPPNERTQFELDSIKWIFGVGFKFFNLFSNVSNYITN